MGVDKGGLVSPGYPDSEGRGRRRWGEQSTDFIQQVISPVFWIGDQIMFIIGCSSCLFRCTNMAWRRIASHSGMSGRSCIGKTGRWQGFKISSKLEWPGSLFRAGGAPVSGGGRVLHWLPSHSQKVPQLQRNSLWRTFQFLSTSYFDINSIVLLWFIFGTPDQIWIQATHGSDGTISILHTTVAAVLLYHATKNPKQQTIQRKVKGLWQRCPGSSVFSQFS